MAVGRVGLPAHLVDRVGEALLRGRGGDALRDAAVAFDRAEFLGQIIRPRHAGARHPGIEEIGPEIHLDRNVRPQLYGLLQPALSNEAPGAHHVGDDIDLQRFGLAGRGHGGPFCWSAEAKPATTPRQAPPARPSPAPSACQAYHAASAWPALRWARRSALRRPTGSWS